MKKILVITVAIMLLLSVFISCGRNNAGTTVIYTPGTFPDDYVNDAYAPIGGHNYHDKIYNFKSDVQNSKKNLSDKTVELFGKMYILKYYRTTKPQFATIAEDVYDAYNLDGTDAEFVVKCASGTDKILSASGFGKTVFEEAKIGKLKTEDDFITYAKEILSRYLNSDEYGSVFLKDDGTRKLVYFYKLLDGYRTTESIVIYIRNDGALIGIKSEHYGSYDSFKNAKFNKQAIESYAFENKIDSIVIINDDGDLVAEIKYWVTRHVDTTTPADGSPHPTETVLLTRYVPLTKQTSASKVTTAKVTTAAPPIVTAPGTTELIFTTAPAEPLREPQG